MFRTTRSTRTARIAIAAASVAAALALPSAASAAPCEETHDTSTPTFNVSLCHVSDVDQYRGDLPGYGVAYSGPASLFNVLNGMANRQGFLSQADGVGIHFANPELPNFSWLTTKFLKSLGQSASISSSGTTSWGNRVAFMKATEIAAADGWERKSGVIDTMTASEFGVAIAQRLDKAPVQMPIGTFVQDGYGIQHVSTHMVTVVAAKGSTGTGQVELLLHDPARAGDTGQPNTINTQSPYRAEKVTLKRVAYNVKVDGIFEKRYGWQLKGDTYVTDKRLIVESINYFTATK